MCRIWKDFVHPCKLESYIFSSRSLPGNVKAALCVRFLHLWAIRDLNCMPFFSSRLCSNYMPASTVLILEHSSLLCLSVAECRSVFEQWNKNDRLKGFQCRTHKNWRYLRKSTFTATKGSFQKQIWSAYCPTHVLLRYIYIYGARIVQSL